MRRPSLLLGAAALGIIVAVAFLFARGEPHVYAGTVYLNPGPAPAFSLINDSGEVGTLEEYRGKVVLLYFGYTFCPDICPASLAELATAFRMLDSDAQDRVQVMMISVDPARDTPEVLGSYMDHFDPSFVGFTGSDDEIATVTEEFGVFYQAQEGTAATGYLVDHWAGTYLIDPDGRLVESFGFGTPGEDIAADVEEWM